MPSPEPASTRRSSASPSTPPDRARADRRSVGLARAAGHPAECPRAPRARASALRPQPPVGGDRLGPQALLDDQEAVALVGGRDRPLDVIHFLPHLRLAS